MASNKQKPKAKQSQKKSSPQQNKLRVSRAIANKDKLISSRYLHSYRDTYDAILNSMDLTELDPDSFNNVVKILDTFIKDKRTKLRTIANYFKYDGENAEDDFVRDLQSAFNQNYGEGTTAAKYLEAEASKVLLGAAEDGIPWQQKFEEMFTDFVNDDETSKLIERLLLTNDAGKASSLSQSIKNYKAGQLLSDTEMTDIKNAFLRDVTRIDPQLGQSLTVLLFGSDSSNQTFAALIGASRFGKTSLDENARKGLLNNLNTSLEKNLGLNGVKGNAGIRSHVMGQLQEGLALLHLRDTFQELFNFNSKDIYKYATGKSGKNTVKQDITIELPNMKLGISVKSFQNFLYSSNFQKMATNFKIQDLTLSNLESTIATSANYGLLKVIDQVYYLMLNESFLGAAARTDNKKKRYVKRPKTKMVSEYLNKYFTALAAWWVGDAIQDIDENGYMDIGLIYDPSANKIIPAYTLLESIKDNIKTSSKSGQLKMSYSIGSAAANDSNAEKFFRLKIAPKAGKITRDYSSETVDIGSRNGREISMKIKIKIVGTFLDDFIKKFG